ncbi:hypothetical protein F4805DRAFT_474721 [Annulohypoxylon moriforme]|nr:hypothetical protein F4805DRAFT_474721 [Annulohypoxylon moriforme]
MDLTPTLRILGVDSLVDTTLEELQSKVNNVQYGVIPRRQVLQTFMGWLHAQITRDIQQKSLLSTFMDLLLTPGKLHQGTFDESEVEVAFKGWQAKDAVENPTNIRRYQVVYSDLVELFEHGSKPEPDWSFGPSGLDREQDSSDEADGTRTRLVGGGKRKSGSNEIPLGKRKHLRSNSHQKIVKIEEESEKEQPTLVESESRFQGPSDLVEPHPSDTSLVAQGPSSSPPPSYICSRCHKPGHWIQLCPTNTDPKWDRPPPPNYTCEICKKKGDHFTTSCPQKQNKSSWTEQRQHQEEHLHAPLKTPTRDSKTHSRDRYRLTPPSGHLSQSPKGNHYHQAPDIYRPDDDSSQVRSSGRDNHGRLRDRSASPQIILQRITPGKGDNHEKGSSNRPHKLPYRRSKAPPTQGNSRPSLSLNGTQKGETGRLSYDDVFTGFGGSSLSPKEYVFSRKQKANARPNENEVGKHVSADVEDTHQEMGRAEAEFIKLFDEVTNELYSAKAPVRSNEARPVPGDSYMKSAEGYLGDKTNIEEQKNANGTDNSFASSKIGQHHQEPRSGLDITALLKELGKPIIRRRTNRKTAAEMLDEVENPKTEY